MLIPYHKHTFSPENGRLPIEELVIGPTSHPQLACEAAQELLVSRDLMAARVKLSSIPYRTW